jgi:precorrin-3B synthase
VHLDRTPLGAADAVTVAAAVQTLLAAIAAQGALARGRDLGAVPGLRLDPARAAPRPQAIDPIGAQAIGSRTMVGLGFAFGQATAADLAAIAQSGATEFRLAPGRVLLAVDPPSDFFRLTKRLGFIVEAADPRRQIAACAGAPRCASGLIDARTIAEALARALDQPRTIHVSGCVKGCAHPGAAPLTIVGTAAGAALVRNGTTRDAASVVVPPDQLVAAIIDEAVAA